MLLTEEKEIQNSRSELEQIDQKMQQSLDALKVNCQTPEEQSLIAVIDQELPRYMEIRSQVVEMGLKTIMMRRWTYSGTRQDRFLIML